MTASKFARAASFLCAAAAAALLSTGSARAALIVNIEQVGLDIVATYSGTLNYGGAATSAYIFTSSSVSFNPSAGSFGILPSATNTRYTYASSFTTPFGTGGSATPTSYAGDAFVVGSNILWTSQGFANPGSFSGSMTFAGETYASMGLVPGSTSVATLPNDTITFAVAAVPLPAALPMLGLGLGAMGLIGARRRRKTAA
jgi:hypothetical protein